VPPFFIPEGACPPPVIPMTETPPDRPADPPPAAPGGAEPRRNPPRAPRLKDRLTLFGLRALALLPFRARIALAGWVGRTILSRVSSIRPRIRAAVRHLFPDLPQAEVNRISARVPENMALTAIELLSGADFYRHTAGSPVSGPGWEPLQQARREGRPALLLIAHFGNFGAVGSALKARGFNVGTFYTAMPDPATNRFYTAALGAMSSILFPAGREGVGAMVRHLRRGGILAISNDLDRPHGVMLDFLGKPARTVLSMAEMALKYDALLIPVYGIRREDGRNFDVFIDAPIPHGDPLDMTQALNESLGRMVTRHKDQWLWWHHRWRGAAPGDAVPPAGER